MKPENFKKGIKELRGAGLTKSEKETMLKNIVGVPLEIPRAQTEAPFVKAPFTRLAWEAFTGYSRFSYAFAAVVIFLLSGTSVMYASERALPGDILYEVKVGVTEPLRDKFIRKPEARAEWEVVKAERRMEEAETLALERKLDEPRRVKLEKNFEKHADGVAKAISDIKEDSPASTTTNVTMDRVKRKFDSAVSSHEKTLEKIRNNTGMSEQGKKEIESFKESINRKIKSERNIGNDENGSGSGSKEKRNE